MSVLGRLTVVLPDGTEDEIVGARMRRGLIRLAELMSKIGITPQRMETMGPVEVDRLLAAVLADEDDE